jgi:geranylgeranyl pyrophosphate synthase
MSILEPVRHYALQHALLADSSDARAVIEAYRYQPAEEPFPCLPLLSYRMHGGKDDHALPLTSAYYLTNLASEVLDDMMDGEQKTVWANWGVSRIVLVAVELLTLSQACLARTSTDATTLRELIERFAEAIMITSSGQRKSVRQVQTLDAYWDQAVDKSGAYFAFGMWSGAKLAGAALDRLEAATRFGAKLGVLSQIMDDIIDFVTETPGARSNSTEFDSSLPVVMALASKHVDVPALQQALSISASERTNEWHNQTRRMIVDLGGLANAMAMGKLYREDLMKVLDQAPSPFTVEIRSHIDAVTAISLTAEAIGPEGRNSP